MKLNSINIKIILSEVKNVFLHFCTKIISTFTKYHTQNNTTTTTNFYKQNKARKNNTAFVQKRSIAGNIGV